MDALNRARYSSAAHEEETLSRDVHLVSAAQSGSSCAFGQLHALYSRRLYKTIFAITKNHEDAEDVLQETFLNAYRSIAGFEGRSAIYSWLTRIAINSALMTLRKRRARLEVPIASDSNDLLESFSHTVPDPSPNPEQLCELHQRKRKVLGAVRGLTPQLRQVVQARMVKDASLRDISRILNISLSAAKTRLHRARLKLSTTYQRAK